MTDAARRRSALAFLMSLAASVFFTGIGWGLPSRDSDPFLFGDQPVWSGEKIMRLAGDRKDDASLGVDVSRHPLAGRDKILVLNGTDADRAEIIRRYRLYSAQPDENLTLMSLARMRPSKGDFDPKIYQYGGLYVYAVGAALKVASVFRYVQLRPDVAWYIDHPEAFGRFYVVARAVPALWGVAGIWPVFWIARRLGGGIWMAAAACVAYAFMPVVVNMAHEAKPHLPGAVLMLFAVVAACKYVETGKGKYAIGTGILCGAAFGTVLSAALIFVVIPVMAALRRQGGGRRLRVVFVAGIVGLLTYFATNPYVAINLATNRALLRSNLTNSTDMYRVGGWASAIPTALRLIGEGATPGLALAGVVAVIAGGVMLAMSLASSRKVFSTDFGQGGRATLAVLLAAPSALIFVQFLSLSAGKPAEYARFAMFPDIALAIAAVAGVSRWVRSRLCAWTLLAALVLPALISGGHYVIAFVRDAGHRDTRAAAANRLLALTDGRAATVALWAEPAPYATPPMNLFRDTLLLVPRGYALPAGEPPADIFVRAVDVVPASPERWDEGYKRWAIGHGDPTPISWADKPFEIYVSPAGK